MVQKIILALAFGVAAVPASHAQTWEQVGPIGPSSSVAVDPFDSSHVLAASGGEIIESKDGGMLWFAHPTEVPPSSVVFDRLVPGLVFAACFGDLYRPDNGVFVSFDGGTTWSPTGLIGPKVVILSLAVGDSPVDRVFAAVGIIPGFGSIQQFDVWSDDHGQTWTPFPSTGFMTTITPAPGSPIVYAESAGQVVASGDEGATWSSTPRLPTSCSPSELLPARSFALGVDPHSPDDVFAESVVEHFDCSRCGGLSRSTAGGASWAPLDPGQFFTSLVIDPVRPGVIYAAAALREYQGCPAEAHTVIRSGDDGATWTAFDAGLDGLDVFALAIDPEGHRLFGATAVGIFVLDLSVPSGRPGIIVIPTSRPAVVTRPPTT